MNVTLTLTNGVVLGLEHLMGDEDDDYQYVIVLHVLCFRFCFIKPAY